MEAGKVLLHTYAASSNPELLAEEAEGEVIVFEFIDLLDHRECQRTQSKQKEKDKEEKKEKEKEEEKEKEGRMNNDYEHKEKEENEEGEDGRKNNTHMHQQVLKNNPKLKESEREGERDREREREYESRVKNTLSTIAILDFQLPIHLRYHTPYDEYLPVENTETGKYPDYKKVIIPYPTVFRSAENCIQHTERDRPFPRIKRIYDVSFLGQKGNVQSSMMDGNFYVKLNSMKKKISNKQIQETDKGKEYEVDKMEVGRGVGIGGERGEEDKEEEEEEQTIELKVPIGCYSNDFVLIVTVACYFFSSSAIVYSLVF